MPVMPGSLSLPLALVLGCYHFTPPPTWKLPNLSLKGGWAGRAAPRQLSQGELACFLLPYHTQPGGSGVQR